MTIAFEPGPQQEARLVRPVFARAETTLSLELDLPADLRVRVVGEETAAGLSDAGPHFDRRTRTVYFPWSFVEGAREDLEQLRRAGRLRQSVDRALVGAMTFVLYHEITHGLVQLLDLDMVVDRESAADSLAGILAIASGPQGQLIPLGAAALLEARALRSGESALSDYASRHRFDLQRAFDAVCLVHGSGLFRSARLRVGGVRLSPMRAAACRSEYQGTLRAWRRVLGPWLHADDGLRSFSR